MTGAEFANTITGALMRRGMSEDTSAEGIGGEAGGATGEVKASDVVTTQQLFETAAVSGASTEIACMTKKRRTMFMIKTRLHLNNMYRSETCIKSKNATRNTNNERLHV